MCHTEYMKIREQPAEIGAGTGSLLPSCDSWGSNSSYQAWWQAPSPGEPSCQPLSVILNEYTKSFSKT